MSWFPNISQILEEAYYRALPDLKLLKEQDPSINICQWVMEAAQEKLNVQFHNKISAIGDSSPGLTNEC